MKINHVSLSTASVFPHSTGRLFVEEGGGRGYKQELRIINRGGTMSLASSFLRIVFPFFFFVHQEKLKLAINSNPRVKRQQSGYQKKKVLSSADSTTHRTR
jgi:hypothetical protein